MKKYLLLLLILLTSVSFASAQKHGHAKPDEKMFKEIQEYKIKYLAQEMELKDDQKDKFVETYQQLSEERQRNFQKMKALEKSLNDKSSDSDYKEATEAMADLRMKDAQLEKEYDAKFAKFLTSKQIYKMKEAEDQFRRKMHEMRQKKCAEKKSPRK